MKKFFPILVLVAILGLTGCSSTRTEPPSTSVTLVGTYPDDANTPTVLTPDSSTDMVLVDDSEITQSEITTDLFPDTSRYMHDLNIGLIYALKPSLDDYKREHITFIYRGFSNALKNLKEPLTAVNSLLQLDLLSTAKTIGRFAINSTIGLLGTIDVAGSMGIGRDDRDFGQTMGVYGVPSGGFFVMPLYAQTTTRDFSGTIVDSVINPVNYVVSWGVGLFIGVSNALMDLYESYDFILATHESSLDSYATFKTMYLQNRQKKIDEHKLFFRSTAKSPSADIDSDTTASATKSETNTSSDISAYDFDM